MLITCHVCALLKFKQLAADPVQHLNTFLQQWKTTTTTAAIHPILPTFLTSWLSYLLTTIWSPSETSPEQAEREWKSFDQTYAEANRIFTGPGGAEAVGVWGKGMKKMAENLMHLAFRSANLSRDKRFSKPSISIDRVRKTFSAAAYAECRMDESDLVPKRGDEAFALGNICWRVYDQTYASMRPSVHVRLGAPCTSKAERVGYWYWLGKTSLAKGSVRRVSTWFRTIVSDLGGL
ncbi:hypothetical protein QFC21_000753 [Naganishia friedmannii]|uniref:Uncharacterized protein n=1 Tax=Naganishia friedmannii TaxID=89922 RepID=A0ACC2W6F0_9TREE|nr:hypothetical protein QFC21_000753 [Naganishia friedmannii]